MQKSFRTRLCVLSIIAMVAMFTGALLPGGTVNAKGEQAVEPFRWELVLDLDPAIIDTALSTPGVFLDPFKSAGVAATLQDTRLSLKGQGGLEQMSAVLFDTDAPGMDFLGGAVDLYIHLPAGSAPIELNLEARVASGYAWQVLPADGTAYVQSGQSKMAPRYRAYGSPSIQTILLTSSGSGDALARLVYHRPFEPAQTSRARLDLYLAEVPTRIDIFDPTPRAPLADAGSTSVSTGEDPIAAIPEVKGLPASWDWRSAGIVPPVRDQGGCGSCWAFGTVGVMESAVKKGGGPLTDLSEQFLVSCNTSAWSCSGGLTAHDWHYDTLALNQSKIGAVLETAKPYTATNGSCSITYNHPYKLDGWKFVTGSEWTIPTVTQIKNAIYTYGPITSGVCALSAFQAYNGGVFSTSENCGGYTNHQIILTGWDDATQTWILRNSWGSSWGESGYMHIKWGTSRVGEGTSWVKYTKPVVNIISPALTTTDRTPTFKWTSLNVATAYHFQVYQGSNLVYERKPNSSVCNDTTCERTPATQLLNTTYKWRVRARVGGVWQTWTAFQSFSVVPIAFNSRFNGTKDDWARVAGGTWQVSSTALYTAGLSENWTSAMRQGGLYSNFDYSARVKRSGQTNFSNYLAVRMGNRVDKAGHSDWYPGYVFGYVNDGYYSIWKLMDDGTEIPLQPWTKSPAIIPNDWNTLRVLANQDEFKFFINGSQVSSITDSTFTSGSVGVQMYRVGTDATRFSLDWAKLYGLSVSAVTTDNINAEQQSLNEAALKAPLTGSARGNLD